MSLQHGFTVQPTGNSDLDRLQQRIKVALDTLAANVPDDPVTDETQYIVVGAQEFSNQARGADIPSATTIAAKTGYHRLTGTTNVSRISKTGWFDGARIEFYVVTGITFTHNTAGGADSYALSLTTLANTTIPAGGHIAFRRDDALSHWVQVG